MVAKKGWMVILMMVFMFNASAALGADVTAGVDLNSAYIWRGLTFNNGMVAQPSLDVTSGGWNLNVWANYDLEDYNGALEKNEFSEVDLTGSYTYSIGPVDLTGGIIEYLFPATEKSSNPSTQELFLDVSCAPFKNLEGFSIGTTGYYDFDEVDDYYINPYVGYSMELCKGFAMDLGASCGIVGKDFSEFYSGGTQGGFHEYTLTVGTSYTIDKYSFTANFGHTGNLKKAVLPDPDVDYFGGGGISIAF